MADRNFTVNMIIGARDRATRVVNRFRAALGALNNRVVQVGAALTAFFSLRGITRLFSGAISSAADFEQQLATVQAVSGATTEQMQRLREEANRLGASTTFTNVEAAQALENLTRAGQDAEQAIQSLEPVLKLAEANSLQLGEAASFVTDALGAFGAGADQAGRFADVLTEGAQQANTSVQRLGVALSQGGVVAKQAGLSIEETVGALDALANAGIRGERAGTALRNILTQIQNPSSKASQALEELGIQSDNIFEVLSGLNAAGDDASTAIREFGRESAAALRTLVQSSDGPLAGFVEGLEQADGAASETAETLTDTLKGAAKEVGSAWNQLRQTLVRPLLPLIEREAENLAAKLREITSGDTLNKLRSQFVGIFNESVEAIKEFVKGAGGVPGIIDNIEGFAADAKETISGLTSRAEELGTTVDKIAKTLGVFTESAKTIGGGISTAFSGAVAGVSKAELELRKLLGIESSLVVSNEQLKSSAEGFGQAFLDSASFTRDSMKNLVNDASELVNGYKVLGEEAGKAGEKAKSGTDKAAESASEAADDFDVLRGKIGELKTASDALALKRQFEEQFESGKISARQFADAINELSEASNGFVNPILNVPEADLDVVDEATEKSRELARAIEEIGAGTSDRSPEDVLDEIAKAANNNVISLERAKEASVQLSLATGGAVDPIRELSSLQLKQSESADESADSTNKAADAASKAGQRFQDLDSILQETGINESQQQAIRTFAEQFENAEITAREFVEQVDQLALPPGVKEQLKALVDVTDKAGGKFEDLKEDIQAAGTDKKLQELAEDARELAKEGEISQDQLATLLEEARKRADKATTAFQKFGESISEASGGAELSRLQEQVNEAFENGNLTLKEREKLLRKSADAQDELADKNDDAADSADEQGDAAEESGEKTEESGEKAEKASGGYGALAGALDAARNRMRELSDSAAQAFRERRGLQRAQGDFEDIQAEIESVSARLGELRRAPLSGPNSLTGWLRELEKDSLQVRKRFLEQKQAAQNLQEALEGGEQPIDVMNTSAEDLQQRFDLLGEEDLSGLQSALSSAQQRVEGLRDSAESTLQSLRDELRRSRGEFEELERARLQRERQDIRSQLAEAQAAGSPQAVRDLQRALATLDEVGEQRLEQARQREREAREQDQQPAATTQQGGQQQRPTLGEQPPGQVIELRGPDGERTKIGVDGEDDARQLVDTLRKAGFRTG